MIVVYRVEAIKGGYVTRVASDVGVGAAQGRSRIRSIESAAVLTLQQITAAMDAGTIALADVFPIRFEEAT